MDGLLVASDHGWGALSDSAEQAVAPFPISLAAGIGRHVNRLDGLLLGPLAFADREGLTSGSTDSNFRKAHIHY